MAARDKKPRRRASRLSMTLHQHADFVSPVCPRVIYPSSGDSGGTQNCYMCLRKSKKSMVRGPHPGGGGRNCVTLYGTTYMAFRSNDGVVPTKTGIARLRSILSRCRGHVAFWVGRPALNTRCPLNRALISRHGQPLSFRWHSSETPPGGYPPNRATALRFPLHGISLTR